MGIYDFEVTKRDGEKVSLSEYNGKTLLIVNSATECGFTPQYEELQKLYEKYKDQGFVILDFPCNQFGNQAPGTHDEIATFCTSNFGVTFPIFAKVEVNGPNADPLFTYLKTQKGFAGFDETHKITPILKDILTKQNPDYETHPDIKWNFTKFLINKTGTVVTRFEPTESITNIETELKKIL